MVGGPGGDGEYCFRDIGSFPGVPAFSGVGKKYKGAGVKRVRKKDCLSMSGFFFFQLFSALLM